MYNPKIDLTVVSNIAMADGIGRQGPGIIGAVHDSLKVNALQLGQPNYKNISKDVLNVLIKPFDGFGRVTFWTYILGLNENMVAQHKNIASPIKIAYSMFESDAIPKLWTNILNSYYDMVVVPDEYLVSVYKSSGVKIPIFVIPLGIMVENLLERPLKTKVNDPFTFGMSAGFWSRKGHIEVLKAFAKSFGNNPKFRLRLHGRFGPYKIEVEKAVSAAKLNNVELLTSPLSPSEYDDFMDSIDCYTFPSMGEGFSITPRETLALGKPCIVSNNTCHKTICNSGFVVPLPANTKVPAVYEVFGNQTIGNYYKGSTNDLSKLMEDVSSNYDEYLAKASGGREWVKQYLWPNLKPIYLNLFNPKSIQLDTNNHIDANSFKTNDKVLFNKIKTEFKL